MKMGDEKSVYESDGNKQFISGRDGPTFKNVSKCLN